MNENEMVREAVEILKGARALVARNRAVGRYSDDHAELGAGLHEALYGERDLDGDA